MKITRMSVIGGVAVMLMSVNCTPASANAWSSSEQATQAAQALLATLDSRQVEAVRFPFDSADRANWSNLPVLMVPPPGLMLKNMNDEQRKATQALLRASLSGQGYAKFTGVMRLEDVLKDVAQARYDEAPPAEQTALRKAIIETRDPEKYAVAIFGEPGSSHWGWKLAGHHAAVNFTVSEGRLAFTPVFLGSSPRVIQEGPYAGTMVLPQEGSRGIELMEALTPAQQDKARIADELTDDIFAGPGRQASLQEFEGLVARELDSSQKRLLRVLVGEYVGNADFDAAQAQLTAIAEAGWDNLWFSWRGPVDADGRFYYRIHGPRLLIEYNRQDANHDHLIMRDPGNDYGADWLGKHLEEHHPGMDAIREATRQRVQDASSQ